MPTALEKMFAAIVDDDRARVRALLKEDRGLVAQQTRRAKLYESQIFHWLYVGDTPLHLAAAGHRAAIARALLAAGADPIAATNHRRSHPLHYAADGYVSGPAWHPVRQVETIRCLLDAGADIDAQDKNGATPLHRAVRTRCAAAVAILLQSGCNPTRPNKSGSTAFHLAVQNTGRGGSGQPAAKAAQREIIRLFLAQGVSDRIKNGKGVSVRESAKSSSIRDLLDAGAGAPGRD